MHFFAESEVSRPLWHTPFLLHKQVWHIFMVCVVGVMVCRAGIYQGNLWCILACKCHMWFSDYPILVSFQSKIFRPNPLSFCNCIVGYCTGDAHFLFPLNLLQSHTQPVWMQFAVFSVAIVQRCVCLVSNQKGSFVVVTIDFLKGLPVLIRTIFSLFPSIPSRLLYLLLGHIIDNVLWGCGYRYLHVILCR